MVHKTKIKLFNSKLKTLSNRFGLEINSEIFKWTSFLPQAFKPAKNEIKRLMEHWLTKLICFSLL
jgi:hypothetical protein